MGADRFANYRSFSIKIPIGIHDLDYIGLLKISQLKTPGDWFRKKRLERGLTQKQLADTLSVTDCTIRNWEKGRTRPKTAVKRFFQSNM